MKFSSVKISTSTLNEPISQQKLAKILKDIFDASDVDGNGNLDQPEFVKCIMQLSKIKDVKLDPRVAMELFKLADVSEDGLVAWGEFIGPAVAMIDGSIHSMVEDIADDQERRRQLARDAIMASMDPRQMQESLQALFAVAQEDKKNFEANLTGPASNLIDVTTLEAEAPSLEVPDVEVGALEAEAPSLEAEAPSLEAEAPSLEVPEVASLEAEAPSLEAEAPSLEVPEVASTKKSGPMQQMREVLASLPFAMNDAELNFLLYMLGDIGEGMPMQRVLDTAFDILVDVVSQTRDFSSAVAQHDQQVEEEIMATAICDTMGMSMEELSGILENVFFSHDVDGNGVLDQSEFVKCVVELGTKLNIDKRLGSEIFRAVDVNGDGLIEWKEFVGPAVRIIHSSVAEGIAQEIEIAEEAKIIRRQTAEDQVLASMQPQELDALLANLFKEADQDGSGFIEPSELRSCLQNMPLQLSDQELNYLLFNLDYSGDGKLSIEEFLPLAFEMLVEVVAQMRDFDEAAKMAEEVAEEVAEAEEVMELAEDICDATGLSPEELSAILETVFVEFDVDQSGVLDQSEFVKCVVALGKKLNIDKRFGAEIFRAVDVNGDGLVEWREFVGPAVRIIHGDLSAGAVVEEIPEPETEAERRRKAQDQVLGSMSEANLEQMLRDMFAAADQDKSGKVDLKELRVVLAGLQLSLSDNEINFLMYNLDTDQDGRLSIEEFMPMAFSLIVEAVMQMRSFD